ncbi:MAG TPA: CPXCG motif-containing cysteine-rich protein [Gemmatimonadales bacterium]
MTQNPTGRSPEEQDDHLGSPEDGTWSTEAEVTCPYCGEEVMIHLDPGGGSSQAYVEDCQVCCQPWQVYVTYDDRGDAEVSVEVA